MSRMGSIVVSTRITPLTNQGPVAGGIGALRYQRDRATGRIPHSASATSAASRPSAGVPWRAVGRFAPSATRIIVANRVLALVPLSGNP